MIEPIDFNVIRLWTQRVVNQMIVDKINEIVETVNKLNKEKTDEVSQ